MTLGHTKLILLASAATVLFAGAPARAADVPAAAPVVMDKHTWDIAFGVTFTTDYISRGATQTDYGPAIQPWAELTIADCFYVGYWGSNVGSSAASTAGWESDLSVGVRPKWGPVNFDFGYVRYLYSNSAFSVDYGEVYAKASISPVDKLTLGAAVYVNPEATGSNYVEANAAYQIHDTFKVSGAIGQANGTSFGNYFTWNAGVAWNPWTPVTIDARYHNGPASNKFVLSLSLASSLKTLGVIH